MADAGRWASPSELIHCSQDG
ncbi:uncharacterized protein G2W53_020073 [Senna tora]|uniref:Uncharacterized protein n=1 Tax=Senna tora TaxID=362788 RepID=A0A834TVY9_9FABA|nr:uncharacterized protein G2W53_020073 [Senna tora]